ncbi:hypothetical protein ScPMuIL_006991 [Solemya velum]
MALQVTSCTLRNHPTRLLEKGPDYFKRRTNARIFAGRRKSAVELLEASKPDYVKSTSVLNHRQELKHPSQLNTNSRHRTLSSSQPKRAKSEYDLSQCQKTFGEEEFKTDQVTIFKDKCGSLDVREIHSTVACDAELQSSTQEGIKINTSVPRDSHNGNPSSHTNWPISSENSSVITKDRSKMDVTQLTNKDDFFSPKNSQSLSASVTVLVEQRCSGTSKSEHSNVSQLPTHRKKLIHRSHSDLSCRHSRHSSDFSDLSSRLSRTSTELDRFFSEMGLDKSVLDPMLKLQDSQLTKDLDAVNSTSSLGSPARSSCSRISHNSREDGVNLHDGSSTQMSVVERNARIIKWLCNVRKAHAGPTDSTLHVPTVRPRSTPSHVVSNS